MGGILALGITFEIYRVLIPIRVEPRKSDSAATYEGHECNCVPLFKLYIISLAYISKSPINRNNKCWI